MTDETNAKAGEQSPPQPKPVVVVVFNQKGGIGKTTTSVNLAVCLAALGRRTVLIDLDAQSNASTSVGLSAPAPTGAYQLLNGEAGFAQACRPTPFPNLRLVAGSDDLSWSDVELAVRADPQYILQKALADAPDGTEIVVIDCPPAFGILSVNAAAVADAMILPVAPSPMALDGLHKAWWNIQRVRKHFNRELDTLGILFTMTEDSDLMNRLTEAIASSFGGRVLPVMIPRDMLVIEASARDIPLVVLDPDSPAALAYRNLAELALNKLIGKGRLAVSQDAAARAGDTLREWRKPRAPSDDPDALPSVHESPPLEAGPTPGPDWNKHVGDAAGESDDDLVPPDDLRWKVGVAVMLVLLGAVVGFAFGRWMYFGG